MRSRKKEGNNKLNALKKINRGLLVTLLVVLAVGIYLLINEMIRAGDRTAIQEMLESYVPAEAQLYTVSREQTSESYDEMSEAERNALIDATSSKLAPYFVNQPDALRSAAETIARTVNQRQGLWIDSVDSRILKLSSFTFNGSAASVKAKIQMEFEGSPYYISGQTAEQTFSERREYETTFILQKEDGEWKLFYSSGLPLTISNAYDIAYQ